MLGVGRETGPGHVVLRALERPRAIGALMGPQLLSSAYSSGWGSRA